MTKGNKPLLLEMSGVSKSFQSVKALTDVSFQLKAGEVHALMGENGAGKSTLIKILAGIYSKDSGEIKINGQKVEIESVAQSHDNGIAVIHQELVLVNDMSVAENIYLGREPLKNGLVDKRKMIDDAQKLLDEFDAGVDASTMIRNLPIAKQQMVEIIKAMSFNSQILVMDEPTSSISDKEVAFLFEIVRKLKARGVGIIYISHKMSELEEICDRVSVLCDGCYVGTEIVGQVTKDKLISMMIGRDLQSYYPREFGFAKDVALRCENINDGNMVTKGTFEVRHGEIVGFAGLVGAGRSELMKCIFGLTKKYSGKIYINGEEVTIHNPIDAMNHKIGLVPENRKEDGLYKLEGVRYNTTIEVLKDFMKGILVNDEKEHQITQDFIEMFKTKASSHEHPVGTLSGGNQQKVMISRWLATNPDILILDEPTRGVDVGAKAEIYSIMNDLVQKGIAIIMISSELPEIINMSDRVYVMRLGEVVGEFSHEEVSQEKIMRLAAN